MKTILIMGSTFDEPHAKKITDKIDIKIKINSIMLNTAIFGKI